MDSGVIAVDEIGVAGERHIAGMSRACRGHVQTEASDFRIGKKCYGRRVQLSMYKRELFSSFDPTMSKSASLLPAASTPTPSNKHALTGVEKQRAQLEKLLKDPSKPVVLPAPPKEKTIRPPREMMKNVQGSSAGAGSGEFHVYKANRRREYERLKLMDEEAQKVCIGAHTIYIRSYIQADTLMDL